MIFSNSNFAVDQLGPFSTLPTRHLKSVCFVGPMGKLVQTNNGAIWTITKEEVQKMRKGEWVMGEPFRTDSGFGFGLILTSDEACEAAHQRVRQREERFQTRRTRFLTGPTKKKKSKQAIVKFNSLNKGY